MIFLRSFFIFTILYFIFFSIVTFYHFKRDISNITYAEINIINPKKFIIRNESLISFTPLFVNEIVFDADSKNILINDLFSGIIKPEVIRNITFNNINFYNATNNELFKNTKNSIIIYKKHSYTNIVLNSNILPSDWNKLKFFLKANFPEIKLIEATTDKFI